MTLLEKLHLITKSYQLLFWRTKPSTKVMDKMIQESNQKQTFCRACNYVCNFNYHKEKLKKIYIFAIPTF